jgi:hypothetical protein
VIIPKRPASLPAFGSRAWRTGVLFFVGLAGIVFVTLTEGGDRPTLLLLFGAMIGLPAFLAVDERHSKPDKPDNPEA